MTALTVGQLYERLKDTLQLDLLGSPDGLNRPVPCADASGPGLVLAGYTGRFVHERLQVLGETEVSYLKSLSAEDRQRNLTAYFGYDIPCVMITKGQSLPEGFEAMANAAGIAILRSQLKTQEFYARLAPFLEDAFAPSTTLHGSLADVYGVGLLFTGQSGIGKSECVLDLVERGHRLVADDVVIARRKGTDIVIGSGHPLQRHFMEIRGVGLIDVRTIFGIRAVRQQKRIEVIVNLVEWKHGMVVERTGLDTQTTTVLDVEIPRISVPLNPGKNITVVAEVIAMNHLLRYSGEDPAQAFNERLKGHLRGKADVQRYLLDDDE
ncbi:MAG TPA: HPr(Ser) kinase/phosphatase [Gemmatimonadaceae bacterium]|nr:HPr(Ser) kinase/phosphatase [Gemmatimonadaceae bacterium]HRQ78037.1 HPr(Ser) kinase/phosphatase [Gemmatimonadaceae bacterium]